MIDKSVVLVSDSLSKSLNRLFKTGGFALAFGFAGLFLIIFANFSTIGLAFPVFSVGCVLTFSCLLFFVVTSFRTRQVANRIKDDLPLLDALQRVALEATELASLTQSFAFKHLTKIQRIVETILPVIDRIPLVGKVVKDAGLADAAKLSGAIVLATENTKDVVRNLEGAIRSGDIKEIKEYGSELKNVLAKLRLALTTDEADRG